MDDLRLDLLARSLPGNPEHACCGGAVEDLCAALVRLLAKGRPVAVQVLAADLDRAPTEVEELLAEMPDTEFDADGRVVGAVGLTLRPTPHRIVIHARVLFTWCALDALTIPPLLGTRVRVDSFCHATRADVRLLATTDRVDSVDPADAVVSLVTEAVGPASGSVRPQFCRHVHFFRSADAAEPWLRDHPGSVVLPVDQAFHLGVRLQRTCA